MSHAKGYCYHMRLQVIELWEAAGPNIHYCINRWTYLHTKSWQLLFKFHCSFKTTKWWSGRHLDKQRKNTATKKKQYIKGLVRDSAFFWLASHLKLPSSRFTWKWREITCVRLAVELLFHADLIWLEHSPNLTGAKTKRVNSSGFDLTAPNKV